MKRILLLPLLIIPMFFFNKPVAAVEAIDAPNQVANGGFETGDLTGWARYDIWKNEPGNQAFDSTLVSCGSATYYHHTLGSTSTDGFVYNRDGSYNLGITSPSVLWSQSEERMGYLRSSNFTLGGTGWISFKLGGGEHPDFAYMSVRRSTDDIEVARFGNRFYGNTTRAAAVGSGNIGPAEFFMYPYYFNLTTAGVSLGTGLYILLCDTAGYRKSALTADSFVTYYAADQTPDANSTATNILPSIAHTGSFTQTYLTTLSGSLTGWTDVDNIWKIDPDNPIFCRSDGGSGTNLGNAADGVLRSSAFNITPESDHIRMGWGGRLLADKQIFISIKEVGSNTEMLRVLRRAALSDYNDRTRQNAMIDLTFLNGNPTTKEYYMEISDNTGEDGGLNTVDSVAFNTDAQWSVVITPNPGDQVTYIWSGAADAYHATGLDTSFPPREVQEATTFGTNFLSQTASNCAAGTGGAMATSGTWTTLSNQYGAMSADAKDYFYGSTLEASITGTKERYLVLIHKYTSLTHFIVNSANNPYAVADNHVSSYINNDMSPILIVLLSATALAAFSFLFFKRKREIQ